LGAQACPVSAASGFLYREAVRLAVQRAFHSV
jgi:hypothetical protein